MAWDYLLPGTAVRNELDSFIGGGPRSSLPSLSTLLYELRFVPTVERMQEADHSLVNRNTANRKVGGPYVSLCLRMPEIERLFSDAPNFQRFIACFDEVAKPDVLAKRCGFWRHPRWQAMGADRKANSKRKMQLAARLMYGLDCNVQFESMAGVSKKRKAHAARPRKRVAEWRKQFDVKERFSAAAIERWAVADHMACRLSSGRLYSLPSAAMDVAPLRSATQVPSASCNYEWFTYILCHVGWGVIHCAKGVRVSATVLRDILVLARGRSGLRK